jgi:hypothetical protein
VFKDLGIPNAEEHLLKAKLTKEALTARAAELGSACSPGEVVSADHGRHNQTSY